MLENWLTPLANKQISDKSQIGYSVQTNLIKLDYKANNVFLVGDDSAFTAASKDALFRLKDHFSDLVIYDLGVFKNDNPEPVISLMRELIPLPGRIIVLSEKEDYSDSIYRALEFSQEHISLALLNSTLDNILKDRTGRTLQSNNLLNISALGYQRHYCSKEVLSYIYESFTHHLSLGELLRDVESAEPILRFASATTINMNVLKGEIADRPNGLDPLEICQLSKYCGMSNTLKVLSLIDSGGSHNKPVLAGQMLWYFLEGLAHTDLYPSESQSAYFQEHIVQTDHSIQFFKFWKSNKTQRWWFEIPGDASERGNIYPCRKIDYDLACRNEISEYILNQINLDH